MIVPFVLSPMIVAAPAQEPRERDEPTADTEEAGPAADEPEAAADEPTPRPAGKAEGRTSHAAEKAPEKPPEKEEAPVVTRHELRRADGRVLRYTATAWHHRRLPADLQAKPLAEVRAGAKAFARSEYPLLLLKGDRLTEQERKEGVARLARLTGLGPAWIDSADLRIAIERFCKELLRAERRTVGHLGLRAGRRGLPGHERGAPPRVLAQPGHEGVRGPPAPATP